MKRSLLVSLVALASLSFGCSADPDDDVGSTRINVYGSALSQDDVANVNVTVSGERIDPPIVRTLTGSAGLGWSGSIKAIPVGTDRAFSADALSATNESLYQGTAAPVEIAAGQTSLVNIFLQQTTPPDPFSNTAPRIVSVVFSTDKVTPESTVSIQAAAVDPDPGDLVSYSWSTNGGLLQNPNAASTTWTAPVTEGVYEIVASALDQKGGRSTVTFSIDVSLIHGRGRAAVTAYLNTWPVVDGLVSSVSPLDVGGSTALDLTATDPDGDVLTYAWVASCDGTFSNSNAEDPVFTLGSLPASGDCVVTATVSDQHGGTNTASITIPTGPGAQLVVTCGDGICEPGEETTCDLDCDVPICGDLLCEADEITTCPGDCAPACGDGVCTPGEETLCPTDCPDMLCGNGICDPGEEMSCPTDCPDMLCGNGICDPGEEMSCPTDCPDMLCGNGICDPSEEMSCPTDCPMCGNGVCDPGEELGCPIDCAMCGNAICDPGEEVTCMADCPAMCGNGICTPGEEMTCPADCPMCGNGVCDPGEEMTCVADCPDMLCGNGICDPGEEMGCPIDCSMCGNGICDPGEEMTCPADCSPVCGDGVCDPVTENAGNCINDCGSCADGFCSTLESHTTCAVDCPCPSGYVDCNGLCKQLAVDSQNCGACGNVCATDESCVSSVCTVHAVISSPAGSDYFLDSLGAPVPVGGTCYTSFVTIESETNTSGSSKDVDCVGGSWSTTILPSEAGRPNGWIDGGYVSLTLWDGGIGHPRDDHRTVFLHLN
jgi:Bacterial Ig domain